MGLIEFVRRNWIFILIAIIAFGIRVKNINTPFGFGHLGHGGLFYSNIARNYLTYGFITTKFGPVVNTGLTDPSHFVYYLHWPGMLFYMLLGLSFKIFGPHEWNARLIPILFSIGNLILIYKMSTAIYNKRIALFASFLFALVPIEAIYGAHVDVQSSLSLFFILLIFFSYLKWKESLKHRYYWFIIMSFLIGSQTDWAIYFTLPSIVLHRILTSKK